MKFPDDSLTLKILKFPDISLTRMYMYPAEGPGKR